MCSWLIALAAAVYAPRVPEPPPNDPPRAHARASTPAPEEAPTEGAPETGIAAETAPPGKHDWPVRAIDRPLVLAPGMIEIRGDTVGVNVSAAVELPDGSERSSIGKPVFLAPHVYYGVTPRITVGITHRRGLCATGEEKGCPSLYDDFAVDGLYALKPPHSEIAWAVHGGLAALQLSGAAPSDGVAIGLYGGVLARWSRGKLAVVADPRLKLGITKRTLSIGIPGFEQSVDYNTDVLSIPLWVMYQANERLVAHVVTGLNSQRVQLDDSTIPFGLGITYTPMRNLDVGGEILFPDLSADEFQDFRVLYLRLAVRL